ncbi:MAG: hypothetical protein MHMPM18_004696, partial [Marteilia pararefringens]
MSENEWKIEKVDMPADFLLNCGENIIENHSMCNKIFYRPEFGGKDSKEKIKSIDLSSIDHENYSTTISKCEKIRLEKFNE